MQPGQYITPTLRLVHTIGQGAMGSVWMADHLGLATRVAVKFLSPAYAQNQAIIERFRREAIAAAQIKSPHVAQVFDHGVTGEGAPYIVMELLDGEDLRARVHRTGPIDPQTVSTILTQAAKALTRAHQQGIVHRDIKPDNIFLVNMDGELLVKVLDFGVAKLNADNVGMTSTGSMMGTPLYMSPEQLLSAKHVDFRSDLWALGVVAYYTLTGRPPFLGDTVGALSVAVHAGVYAPPSSLRPGLSPAVDAWMQRALRRDPAERFGSAKELAEEFSRAVSTQAAAPVGPVGHTVMQLPGETPPGIAGGGDGSQPPGVGAGSPSADAPARTLTGAAATHAGSQQGKATRVVTLVAAFGIAVAGAGVWWFSRAHADGASESTQEAAPAASVPVASRDGASVAGSAPVETVAAMPPEVPVADAAAPAPEAQAAPAASQVPPVTSAAKPPPPVATAGRFQPRPSGTAKPLPTSKTSSPPTPPPPDFGF